MRVVTILGPSQSGKTTLSEALAGLDGDQPKQIGLYGDATVSKFSFMGEPWAILDCPGGIHNLPLIPPALAASDAAVLCVPAEADAALLAAPYLRLLEELGLPTFLFINKMDAATDRVSDIASALQSFCGHAIILRQIPIMEDRNVIGAVDLISERAWVYHEGKRSSLVEIPDGMRAREQEARSELLDHLADFDDALLEELIEDKVPLAGEVYDVAAKVLQHHDLIPALLGAASHGNGLMRLMKSLRHEAPSVEALAERYGRAGRRSLRRQREASRQDRPDPCADRRRGPRPETRRRHHRQHRRPRHPHRPRYAGARRDRPHGENRPPDPHRSALHQRRHAPLPLWAQPHGPRPTAR